MLMCGIPEELITTRKAMYSSCECLVLEEGETTEWFQIKSSVKHGCVCWAFSVFLLVVDYVISRTTEGRRTGIRCKFTSVLEGLDFADDMAFLSLRYDDITNTTSRLHH